MLTLSKLLRSPLFATVLFALCGEVIAEDSATPRFKAVAFDYFVIFNANSVAGHAVEEGFSCGEGPESRSRSGAAKA